MPKDKEEEDTPFNMAMLYYIRLNKRLDEKDVAANNNDIFAWYTHLRTVYRNIFFKIDEKDKKDLDDMFKDAYDHLQTTANSSRLQRQVSTMAVSNAAKILDQIDKKIMIVLSKKNMIFPKIKSGGLKALEQRYGIS